MDWPLLAPMAAEERATLLAATRRRTFLRGEVVFHEGDPADALHLVERGHFLVRVTTPQGDRATLNVLCPGDALGELALLGSGPRSATVLSLEGGTTRTLTGAAFASVCRSHPAVQDLVTRALAERVRGLSERLVETLYVSLDRRLQRRLVELADVFAAPGDLPGSVVVPLTQEHLADLAGGTRPSVNQALQRLQAHGVIELARGKVVVTDVEALRRRAFPG